MKRPRASLSFLLITVVVSGCVSETPRPTQTPPATPCAGTFFDSHVHLERGFGRYEEHPLAEGFRFLFDRTQEHEVGCAVVFLSVFPGEYKRNAREVSEAVGPYPGRFAPFLHVDEDEEGIGGILPTTRTTLALANQPFQGLGEYAFYDEAYGETDLSSEPWPSLLALAAEKGMVIMIHPTDGQAGDLSRALASHPQTRILAHGFELKDDWRSLLTNHSNLFVTIDAAALLREPVAQPPEEPLERSGSILYEAHGKEDFLRLYAMHRDEMVANAVATFSPIIAGAPNQVLWGTDVGDPWHYDPEVYAKVMEMSNLFLDQLPSAHREAYARQNAMTLLAK